MNTRHVMAAIIIVLAANIAYMPLASRLAGLSVDSLFWLHDTMYGPKHDPVESPIVVAAIDEETYRRPPFQSLPKVMWMPQLATVIDTLLQADVKLIAFDVVFPTSVEKAIPGHDRPLLVALRRASQQGKILLGKIQHQVKAISPFAGYSFAVGHNSNIRPLNVLEDVDGIIRRIPLFFRSESRQKGAGLESSMALEIATRTLGTKAVLGEDGQVTVNGRLYPSARHSPLIDFGGAAGWIPAYSLADLHACAQKGDLDYFRRHFAGKTVLLGAVLDVEDRKLTARRLINKPDAANPPPRCVWEPMKELSRTDLSRDTVPGVFVHAAAANMLIRDQVLTEQTWGGKVLAGLAFTSVAAVPALLLPAVIGGLVVLAACLAWAVAATTAFHLGLVLPLYQPIFAGILTLAAILAYRFVVADKDKRYLRQAFSLYLPETIVDRLVKSAAPPKLGGETRDLSVLFSDIKGFTKISEGLAPDEVVAFLNRYLRVMTDTIEANGGFVDKYIGDAVIGVFGAPLDDPQHARHAVAAALSCQSNLHDMKDSFGLPEGTMLITRIGINSGDMLVGNIGSARRFNYTVMGDAVNVAARLESANKVYGTSVLISEETQRRCADAFRHREIDRVRVLGRTAPVTLFEPLEDAPNSSSDDRYAKALATYRSGRITEALGIFSVLAQAGDMASQVFVDRIGRLPENLPQDWDGTTDLDSK